MIKGKTIGVFLLAFLGSSAFAETPEKLELKVLQEQLKTAQKLNGSETCERCAAMESGLCGEMARFTCAPGEYNDGTGIAITGSVIQDKVAALRTQSRERFTQAFADKLGSPDDSANYFRNLTLSALGLTHAPQCEGKEKSPECVKLASTGVADVALKRVFPSAAELSQMLPPGMGGGFGFGAPSVQDIDLLMQNAIYEDTERDLAKEVQGAITDQKMATKIGKDIFPAVRKTLIKKINDLVSDEKTRKQLIDKINGIQFGGVDCTALGGGGLFGGGTNVGITSLVIPNAYYNSMKNEFRYCNGFLLGNQSEFQIVHVIVHELSHSIDPCNIAQGPADFRFRYSTPSDPKQSETEYPVTGLLECLRKPDSVHATTMAESMPQPPQPSPESTKKMAELQADISSLQEQIKEIEVKLKKPDLDPKEKSALRSEKAYLRDELKEKRKELNGLESGGYGGIGGFPGGAGDATAFCMGDQIGEAFADWMAFEVLPDYMADRHPTLSESQFQMGFANAFRGICNNASPAPPWGGGMGMPGFDVHPKTEDRINRLLIVNPKVRAQMGCKTPSKSRYCTGQGETKK